MLDLVQICVVGCCRARWWGERDWRWVSGRNDGGVVVRWEQRVIIAVVICIKEGMPIVGPSGVALAKGLDIMLGEGYI
jgi:hypothetical protein